MLKKITVLFLIFSVIISCNKKDKETSQEQEIEISYQTEHKKPISDDFISYIRLGNCNITYDYSVPNIKNRIVGINDGEAPWEEVEKNTLRYTWDGFQINLRKDILPNKNYVLIAKNSKFEFKKDLDLEKIEDFNENVFGFYQNIMFENKFWLTDTHNWKFIIKADNETIYEGELSQGIINALFFSNVDDDPFIVNAIHKADLHENYTYRIKKGTADIIVVYFTTDYGIYRPMLYLIPNDENDNEYTDINISWNNEILKGIYYFGLYKINELPMEEQTMAIFDFIEVR